MLTLVTSMAIEGDELTVTLDRSERWWGLLPDLRVPLRSIVAVEVVRDGRTAVRGMRAPGLGGPSRRIGTWRAKDDKQYVSVRRDQPAVKVTLSGQRYHTVLIGVDDADQVTAEVRAAARL
jgi:hypothetical protein